MLVPRQLHLSDFELDNIYSFRFKHQAFDALFRLKTTIFDKTPFKDEISVLHITLPSPRKGEAIVSRLQDNDEIEETKVSIQLRYVFFDSSERKTP